MRISKKLFLYAAGLLSGIGIAVATVSGASNSIIPYQFKDGDVISADTLNDLFSQIKSGNQGILSETELNGNWTCTTYDPRQHDTNFQAANFSTDATTGLQTITQTWAFTNSGQTLTVQQAALGGVGANYMGTCSGVTSFAYSSRVMESALMLRATTACKNSEAIVAPITKVSPYKFRVTVGSSLVACVADSQPPSTPSDLTASVASGGVNLTWTDNGGSPTGFKVYKKSSGTYSLLATANSASYTDSAGVAGDMYRVISYNNVGNSLTSSAALAK